MQSVDIPELEQVLPTVLWGIVLQYILQSISFPITRERHKIVRARKRPQPRRTSRKDWKYNHLEQLCDEFCYNKKVLNTIGFVQREKKRTEYVSGGHLVHDVHTVSKIVFILQLKVTQDIVPDETHYPFIVNRWTTSATECIGCDVQFFGPIAETHGYNKKNVSSMVVSGSCVRLILRDSDGAFDIRVSNGFIGQFYKKVINLIPCEILRIE
jgi:hypothetical protein